MEDPWTIVIPVLCGFSSLLTIMPNSFGPSWAELLWARWAYRPGTYREFKVAKEAEHYLYEIVKCDLSGNILIRVLLTDRLIETNVSSRLIILSTRVKKKDLGLKVLAKY